MSQTHLTTISQDKNMICPECGCELKTKYMIRIDYTGNINDKSKTHWEATSKRSVVGWLKLIMNEFTSKGFEDITIYDLKKMCNYHKEFYNST